MILHRCRTLVLGVVVLDWGGGCLWIALGPVAVSRVGSAARPAAEARVVVAGSRSSGGMGWRATAAADAKSLTGMAARITAAAGVLLQVPLAVWGPPRKRTRGPDSWGRRSRHQTWRGGRNGPTGEI